MTRASALLIVWAVFPAISGAVELTWDGGAGNNDWFDPDNWDPNLYPASNYDVSVLSGSPETLQDIITTGGGSITIDGPGTTLTNGRIVYVGRDGGSGSLSVLNGATVAINTPATGWPSLYLGYYGGAEGDLLVQGAGSTLTCTYWLEVGHSGGSGTLEIRDGGWVCGTHAGVGKYDGAQGTAMVHGVGSLWTNTGQFFVGVGLASSGTLWILDGGGLSNDDIGYIGFGSGSTGSVTVDGAGSYWTSGKSLTVGGFGSGTLWVQNGATVSNTNGYVACHGASSTATVGWASTWNNTASLYVGGREDYAGGTGTVKVGFGGAVTVTDTLKLWATGTVDLEGGTIQTGSFDNSAGGTFAFKGGTLTVDAGMFDPGPGDFALDSVGNPTLNLTNGATANLTANLLVGQTFEGTLNIENGAAVCDVQGWIGNPATGTGTGTVTVTGTGSSWTNSSGLYVEGTGRLNIQDGGSVSNTIGAVGMAAGSAASAVVDGPGSSWTNSLYLFVGYDNSAGTLEVSNGGAVSVGDLLRIRGGGTLTLDGGSVQTEGFSIMGGGTFNFNGGSLTVDGGWFSPGPDMFVLDGAGSPTLKLTNGATASLSESLCVGDSNTGALTVNGGSSFSNTLGILGRLDGSAGTVTVDGPGSTWINSDMLFVGVRGTGTLSVANGGSLSTASAVVGAGPGSHGTATLDGAGSTWSNGSLTVGGGTGTGTLTITNGGALSTAEAYVDSGPGHQATVTVTGASSSWTSTSYLTVGGMGTGTVNILDGGALSNTIGAIGMSAGSEGTVNVDGAGSTWTNTVDGLVLGFYGNGSLNITNAATVSNTLAFLGSSSGTGDVGTGTVTVDGPGSTFTNSDDLYVGEFGIGVLNVRNGGAVSNVNGYIAAYGGGDSDGSVTVNGSGSTWSNSASLYVGGHTAEPGGSGILTVGDGAAVTVAGTLKIWGAGTVALDGGQVTAASVDNEGTLSGVGDVQAAAVINRGTVSPGLSAGVTTIQGDYTQTTAGTLAIELQGTAPGSHDRLLVTGLATLDGTLAVSLIDPFAPAAGDAFTVLTYGSRSGEFASITGWDHDELAHLAFYDANDLRLHCTYFGDASLEGCVDGADYTAWADHYGQSGGWRDGDFSGNGTVDGADYTAWADNYGNGCPPGDAIPEPAALALLALGAAAIIRRRRR